MDKIKSKEMSVILFFLVRSSFIGIGIYNVIQIAKQDSWLSSIIALIIGIIPFLLFLYLKNQEENIIQLNKKVFGKLGVIFNLILILFYIFYGSIIMWNLINFVNSQYLFKTPSIVIGIFFLIPIIYTLKKGLKVIGRTSTVLLIMALILFLLAFISLLPKIELNNIYPMFENGFNPIINSTLYHIALTILPIFTLLIIPKKDIADSNKMLKSLSTSYILSLITTVITLFLIISIFGYNLAALYQYPEFNLLRVINIANFFQRVESIISIQWLCNFVVSLIMIFYFIERSILETVRTNEKTKKIIPFFIGIIVLFLSRVMFANNTIAISFLKLYLPYILMTCLFIMPLLLAIFLKLKKN